jgi:hypothetical protein
MFSVLGVIAVILLYPFETTVVPEWKTKIVDESGNPMRERLEYKSSGNTTALKLPNTKRIQLPTMMGM